MPYAHAPTARFELHWQPRVCFVCGNEHVRGESTHRFRTIGGPNGPWYCADHLEDNGEDQQCRVCRRPVPYEHFYQDNAPWYECFTCCLLPDPLVPWELAAVLDRSEEMWDRAVQWIQRNTGVTIDPVPELRVLNPRDPETDRILGPNVHGMTHIRGGRVESVSLRWSDSSEVFLHGILVHEALHVAVFQATRRIRAHPHECDVGFVMAIKAIREEPSDPFVRPLKERALARFERALSPAVRDWVRRPARELFQMLCR